MNTFLPYPSFSESAACLDNKRLGQQRIECKQIYLSLTVPNYGWKNHPAVKMWEGYEIPLARYGHIICREWIKRGYNDSLLDWFACRSLSCSIDLRFPNWLGNPAFHAAMRSNLLRKDFEWYSKFGWTESTTLPYWWPTKEMAHERKTRMSYQLSPKEEVH